MSPIDAAKRRRRPPSADDDWLTPKDAADRLRIGVDTIYDACAKQGLQHIRFGHSSIRIKRAWLDAWAEAHMA